MVSSLLVNLGNNTLAGRGIAGALPNESSRPGLSSSSTPGLTPQNSTTSLPPPPPPPSTSVPPSSTAPINRATPINRLRIQVLRGCIVPSNQCSTVLRKIFEAYMEYDGTSWKNVTAETKRVYYEEFCKRCEWDSIFDGEISRLYHAKAANCYKNMLNDWKRNWFGKGKRPKCLLEDIWQHLLECWGKPDVVKKSEQNSKNRLSEPCGEGTGISIHKGGSKSAQDHAMDIAKEKGEPASDYDVFLRMHRIENNSQSCGKAKKIYDEVQEKAIAITQSVEGSSESQPIDMSKLFVETVGVQKGRVFGIGNISKIYISSSCRSSATSSTTEPGIQKRINEMVEERVGAVRAEMEQQIAQNLRQEMKQQLEQEFEERMQQKMEEMMRNMMQGRVNSPGVNSSAPTGGSESADQDDDDMD